jgi:FG-GAP-like repeat
VLSPGYFGVALNDGTGNEGFSTYTESFANTAMDDCDLEGLQFGDLNGDGRVDLLCVASDGTLSAYLNNGAGSDPGNPTWNKLGVIFSGHGYSRDMVRLADIDGDGRIDYLGLDDAGNAHGWRNVGTIQTTSPTWVDMGIVNSGGTMGDVNGIRFVCLSEKSTGSERKLC